MKASEQPQTKHCPYCAETIPAAAKLCPRCRQWLTLRSFRNPFIALPSIFAPMLAYLILILFGLSKVFREFQNPPPYYSGFQGSLRILESKMQWAETSDGSRLFITGILTNQSSLTWHSVEFETRFFNSNGQMIDAANGPTHFTILAGDDSAFRVIVNPMLSSNDYNSFKISVSTAKNEKSFL